MIGLIGVISMVAVTSLPTYLSLQHLGSDECVPRYLVLLANELWHISTCSILVMTIAYLQISSYSASVTTSAPQPSSMFTVAAHRIL